MEPTNVTIEPEMDYEDNDTYDTIERDIRYIGLKIDRPDEYFETIAIGVISVTILFLFFLIYNYVYKENSKELKNYLALQHLISGLLREACIFFYKLDLSCAEKELTEGAYSCLDLAIPMFTFCLSGVIFLKLFFFQNGEPLYNKKQISVFSTASITIIECYESLFSVLTYDTDEKLAEALRLTSVLLIMSVPIVIFFLIFITLLLKSSEVPKLRAIFFVVHLLVFISGDVLLLLSNFEINGYSFLGDYQILLYIRLVLEMMWYVICNTFMARHLEINNM